MDYYNFVLNTVLDNAYTATHHIIPRSSGGTDDPTNIIKLTPAQHAYAHYLWDREHGTNTFRIFANRLGIKDLDNVTYDDCLPYNFMEALRIKKASQAMHDAVTESWKDEEKTAERKRKMAAAKRGKINVCVNTVWVNNGKIRRRVKADQIPAGFVLGRDFKN